jgi:hypothetical protein
MGLKLYLYLPYLQELILYLSSKPLRLWATWLGSLGRVVRLMVGTPVPFLRVHDMLYHGTVYRYEAVILHPDAGVGFFVVFGDVARRSKASRKASVAHDASEYLGTRPFGIEVASFATVMDPMMWVLRVLLGLRAVVPQVMPPVRQRF